MSRGPEEAVSQRRHTDGQQTHEKKLSISTHQGNTDKNHNEVSPHTCQVAIVQKTTPNDCCRRCGE